MSIVAARQALAAALIEHGGDLAADLRAALAEALAKTSAVDAVCAAFAALKDLDAPSLAPALTHAASTLAEHDYHNLGALASAWIAALPSPDSAP